MFEKISNKLVQIQKTNMREDEIAVYQYGYKLLFEVGLNLIAGMLCGILLHAVNVVILFWIIYIPLRKYCGGWHASRDWVCTVVSTIVLVLAILWCRYYIGLPHIVKTALIILQGVCVIGDIWLAPVAATNKPLTEKERRTYKLIAVILIIVYSLLSWKVEYIRGIVIFSLFIVFLAMSIQRLLDVGTKKVNKNKKGE